MRIFFNKTTHLNENILQQNHSYQDLDALARCSKIKMIGRLFHVLHPPPPPPPPIPGSQLVFSLQAPGLVPHLKLYLCFAYHLQNDHQFLKRSLFIIHFYSFIDPRRLKLNISPMVNEVGFIPFITLLFGGQKLSGHLNRHSWVWRHKSRSDCYCSNTFQWVVRT